MVDYDEPIIFFFNISQISVNLNDQESNFEQI